MALPLPSFFNPDNAALYDYEPDLQRVFEEAYQYAGDHQIGSAINDTFKIEVVGIDLQKDFCFPQGTLYVAGRSGTGAIDDNRKIATFLYQNLPVITSTRPTLDSHLPWQIFFCSFWEDDNGVPCQPHTQIEIADIEAGKYRVSNKAAFLVNGNYQWLDNYARHYVAKLKEAGKYTLYLWPWHCILRTGGHAMAGVISEAMLFHAWVRGSQSSPMVKGLSPFTENYSVFAPEVLVSQDGKPVGQRNTTIINDLLRNDAIVFLGQAASHCVASSIDDLLKDILIQDPKLAQKVYVVEDCMSSVVVPGMVDFTPQFEASLDRYRNAGMHVVKSTDPIQSWPGIRL